jgi:outer membrane protein assembly factor BamD
MIDELRFKLEEKSFNNAKLYFRTQFYKSAVVAFTNLLKDYPASRYKEESLFLSFKSAYYYALNSIETKQEERLKGAREEYIKLVDGFPKSRYLREAEGMYSSVESKLAILSKNRLP